ncbi:MAG: glycosyltransferase [Deltaproteobacteria bacterium]|nr:glycosyltransferase [Deltaproteobacteria bacterium]
MIITNSYPSYLAHLYTAHPELNSRSYTEQKAVLDNDFFAWSDSWSVAMAPLGYSTWEITPNALFMQRAWCHENGLKFDPTLSGLRNTVLAQAQQFRPEIIWFNDYDDKLLEMLRSGLPSLSLVLGWVGSAIPPTEVWRRMDLVLSCAPEAVAAMEDAGVTAEHFPHSFDPRINNLIEVREKNRALSFVGHLMRLSQFHLQREELLEALSSAVPLDIYTPSAEFGWQEEVKGLIKLGLTYCVSLLRVFGVSDLYLKSLPIIGSATDWAPRYVRPTNLRLKPFFHQPVFGLEMYQAVQESLVTLNIHADSSPHFASNMRLYEATGVGTCLVTDWKKNSENIFAPDQEVVVYKNAEECREKVMWLLDHPKEAAEIALAGQKRTLREYTFAHRAELLHRIIGKALSS